MPKYHRYFLLFLLTVLITHLQAQFSFIPPYPFFPKDMATISDSMKKALLVNGAQLKNFSNYQITGATAIPKTNQSDVTDILSIINNTDILILSERNTVFETRAFAVRTIPHLQAKGFSHFLFDLVSDTSYFPVRRKFPVMPESPSILNQYRHILQEPLFASIVREARRSNMATMGLLPSADSSKQFYNYLQKQIALIRTKDSTAKMVIYLSDSDIDSDKIRSILKSFGKLRISLIETYDTDKISLFETLDSSIIRCNSYAIYKSDSFKIINAQFRKFTLVSNFKCFYKGRPYMLTRFMNRQFQNAYWPKTKMKSCPCGIAIYNLDELAFKNRAIPLDVVHTDKLSDVGALSIGYGTFFFYIWNKEGQIVTDYFDFMGDR